MLKILTNDTETEVEPAVPTSWPGRGRQQMLETALQAEVADYPTVSCSGDRPVGRTEIFAQQHRQCLAEVTAGKPPQVQHR